MDLAGGPGGAAADGGVMPASGGIVGGGARSFVEIPVADEAGGGKVDHAIADRYGNGLRGSDRGRCGVKTGAGDGADVRIDRPGGGRVAGGSSGDCGAELLRLILREGGRRWAPGKGGWRRQ